MRIYGITGWKNSGKTGLVERLVAEIRGRGFSVSTVKHAHHSFDVDHEGTDSYRHRAAGAREVMLASSRRWALMHESDPPEDPALADLLARLSPVDLVLIEGYKRDTHPKIEAHRGETGKPLIAQEDETIRAVASDSALEGLSCPVFDLDDTSAIADFILAETGLQPGAGEDAARPLPEISPPPLRDDCFALPAGVEWIPVDKALAALREALGPVAGEEKLAVSEAEGRILAQDVQALRANPPHANSAVDGYGFAHGALKGEGPHVLPLAEGRAAAGAPYRGVVAPGQAIRILTGALLPEGVDTVVLEEDTTLEAGHVAFRGGVRAGANTRAAGEDVKAGETALRAGHRLRAPDLALLAAIGLPEVRVRRRLRVGILSTGDELAEPGSTPDPARTYDANRPMLIAMARRWGHEAVDLGHAADRREAVAAALDEAAQRADAIITSGGASAGDEDHLSRLLRETGSMRQWRVAIKPGRPLALGVWKGVPIFGLPGNPVAAFVCAAIFARPALSLLAGGGWTEPRGITVPAAFAKKKKPGRREYLRARLAADGAAEVFHSEGSGRISGLSWATGLVEIEDGARDIRPGDPVRFIPYCELGI